MGIGVLFDWIKVIQAVVFPPSIAVFCKEQAYKASTFHNSQIAFYFLHSFDIFFSTDSFLIIMTWSIAAEGGEWVWGIKSNIKYMIWVHWFLVFSIDMHPYQNTSDNNWFIMDNLHSRAKQSKIMWSGGVLILVRQTTKLFECLLILKFYWNQIILNF